MQAVLRSPASLAGRAPALVRCGRRVPLAGARSFTTAIPSAPRLQAAVRHHQSLLSTAGKRFFTASAAGPASVAAQQAPNPRAYLESGVIKPREHVDVKKVLVIGSGGLAIGQAGEFDYSGRLCPD